MYFRKPVISIRFRKNKYPLPYVDYGAGFEVSSTEELISKLFLISGNPKILEKNQQKFLSDYVYKLDGKSSQRVKDLIREMLSKNN